MFPLQRDLVFHRTLLFPHHPRRNRERVPWRMPPWEPGTFFGSHPENIENLDAPSIVEILASPYTQPPNLGKVRKGCEHALAFSRVCAPRQNRNSKVPCPDE